VANDILNVANGFVSEYLKNKTFLDKIKYFQFNSHFFVKTTEKAQDISFVYHIGGFFKTFSTLSMVFFNVANVKNNGGHHCLRLLKLCQNAIQSNTFGHQFLAAESLLLPHST
jgi:hypothetical protein